MNRTATFLAIATAALTLASAAGPTLDHAGAKPVVNKKTCLSKGTTVVRKGTARLYVVESKDGQQSYFACSTRVGLHVPVLKDCCDQLGTPQAGFNGTVAAIRDTYYSEGGEASSGFTVWDLRTGKKLGLAAAVGANILAESMGAAPVLLQPDGRLAWIGTATGDEGEKVVEVRTLVKGKSKTLDSGTGIDARSLKVDGSTLSWVKDGVRKSAPFGVTG